MMTDTKNDAKNIFIPQWTEDKRFTSGSAMHRDREALEPLETSLLLRDRLHRP